MSQPVGNKSSLKGGRGQGHVTKFMILNVLKYLWNRWS